MKPVELVVELLGCRHEVTRIRRRVFPAPRANVETRPHRACPAGDLTAGPHRHRAIAVAEVEQLALDGRRYRSHEVALSGPSQDLAGEKSRPIDPEEHPAHSAGPHRLDVDSLRQDRHLAPAHQRDVARLIQHRLADGQQHDHDAHTQGEAQEEKERSKLPNREMAEGQRG